MNGKTMPPLLSINVIFVAFKETFFLLYYILLKIEREKNSKFMEAVTTLFLLIESLNANIVFKTTKFNFMLISDQPVQLELHLAF